MKDSNKYLLSTRPLDETLVNKALKHQVIIDSISFIKTENIIDNHIAEEIKKLASEPIDAVFTSMNGAEAVIKCLHLYTLKPDWKIYCIGAATQSLIKDYFVSNNIAATGKNAAELSKAIIEDNAQKVVFFAGINGEKNYPNI